MLPTTEAGLPIPPKQPLNSYTLFASDYFAKNKDGLANSVRTKGIQAIGAALGDGWTSMSDEERADFEAQAKQKREQYLKDFSKFLNDLKPGQLDAIEKIAGKKIRFPGGRMARRAEQREASGDLAKPLSGYFLFYRDQHEKGQLPYSYATDQKEFTAKNARWSADKWKAMSEEEKAVSAACPERLSTGAMGLTTFADEKPWLKEAAAYRAEYNAWKAKNGIA